MDQNLAGHKDLRLQEFPILFPGDGDSDDWEEEKLRASMAFPSPRCQKAGMKYKRKLS